MTRRDTGFPPHVKELILTRSSGHCEVISGSWCTQRADQYHHRRPRGAGGTRRASSNAASNGLHVCHMCHHYIEDQRRKAFLRGWLVPQAGDPLTAPVMWRGRQVLLDDLGGIVDQKVPW